MLPLTASRTDAYNFLSALGYQRVHSWYESHGDGGSDFYEKNPPMVGGSARVLVVGFTRENKARDLYQDQESRGSFLLATAIEEDQKLLKKHREWEPLGAEKISQCATSGYRSYSSRAFGYGWKVVVSSTAGHGSRAYWEKIEATPQEAAQIESAQKAAGTE